MSGPLIRVKQGDRVRVMRKNELPESTSIQFHGLMRPNDQNGVPFVTQPPIKPGATYAYEFTASNSGSNMYDVLALRPLRQVMQSAVIARELRELARNMTPRTFGDSFRGDAGREKLPNDRAGERVLAGRR